MGFPIKLSGLLIATGAWVVCGVHAQTGNSSTNERWNLRGTCMEVRLDSTALVIEQRPAKFFGPSECQNSTDAGLKNELDLIPRKIPFAFIRKIVLEEVVKKPVQDEIDRTLESLQPENLPSTIGAAGEAGMFALAAPVVLLAEAGTLAPFREIKRHLGLVRIIWAEEGFERSTGLLLSRKDTESLLEQLAQVTAERWCEVRFSSPAPDDRKLNFILHFNQAVDLGEVTVFGGNYTLLIITASDSTRLVYLLRENYRSSQDAITVRMATAAPLGSGKPWKVSLAPTKKGSFCISEVHTDIQRLELSICGELRVLPSSPNSP